MLSFAFSAGFSLADIKQQSHLGTARCTPPLQQRIVDKSSSARSSTDGCCTCTPRTREEARWSTNEQPRYLVQHITALES